MQIKIASFFIFLLDYSLMLLDTWKLCMFLSNTVTYHIYGRYAFFLLLNIGNVMIDWLYYWLYSEQIFSYIQEENNFNNIQKLYRPEGRYWLMGGGDFRLSNHYSFFLFSGTRTCSPFRSTCALPPFFCRVHVAQYLVSCVVFCRPVIVCLFFPSSIDGFWLTLWYLQVKAILTPCWSLEKTYISFNFTVFVLFMLFY